MEKASEAKIRELASRTDGVAEIHHSLCEPIKVRLEKIEAVTG